MNNLDILVNPKTTWHFCATSKNPIWETIMNIVKTNEENATKRVAVKPSTWEALSNLKRPGETFDELLISLITNEQRNRLIHDLDVAAAEPSIPWKEAAKKIGL